MENVDMKDLIDDDNIDSEYEEEEEIKTVDIQIPWIEKYRPDVIDNISSQDEVKMMLKKTLETGDLPHLLLHGPPGTGKTSTVLAIAKQLFGPNVYRERVFELNASDERGISVVRNKIGTISKMSIGVRDENYPCPNYRIIILDEADAMTNDAQSALRKMMEEFSSITRFCFICNYINQIIDPIASRCVKFRFKPISDDVMINKLKNIAENENLKIGNEQLKTVCDVSEGDLRKAITYLQNTKYTDASTESINAMCNIYPKDECYELLNTCKTGSLQDVINKGRELKRSGYSIHSVYKKITECLLELNSMEDEYKSKLFFDMANSERKLISGADEYIQMLSVLSKINLSFKKKMKTPLNTELI